MSLIVWILSFIYGNSYPSIYLYQCSVSFHVLYTTYSKYYDKPPDKKVGGYIVTQREPGSVQLRGTDHMFYQLCLISHRANEHVMFVSKLMQRYLGACVM